MTGDFDMAIWLALLFTMIATIAHVQRHWNDKK